MRGLRVPLAVRPGVIAMRALATVAVASVLLVASAGAAHAESVVLLVDGAAARDDATQRDRAARLARAFEAAGHGVEVVVVARLDGATTVFADTNAAAFAADGRVEVPASATAIDVRDVFRLALERHRAMRPLWLVTSGPFDDADDVVDPVEASVLALGTNRWNGTAPLKSRLFTPDLSPRARRRLHDERTKPPSGWSEAGWIVLAAGPADLATTPWSPWSDAPAEGRVVVPLDAIALGPAATDAPLAFGSEGAVPIEDPSFDEGVLRGRFARSDDAREAWTVSFAATDATRDLWLSAVPAPQSVPWTLAPDARLVGPDGIEPARLAAEGVRVGEPVRKRFLLLRTATGDGRWRLDAPPDSVPGLRVEIGTEAPWSEQPRFVRATPLDLVVKAEPGVAVDVAGTLSLDAGDGTPRLALPYVVRVVPDPLALRTTSADGPLAVPSALADEPLAIEFVPVGPNAPPAAHLTVRTEPPSLGATLAYEISMPNAVLRWDGSSPFELSAATPITLRPIVLEGAAIESLVDGSIVFEPTPSPFVEGRIEREVRVRRPHLVVSTAAGGAAYRVVAGRIEAERPLVVVLDDQGLDGAWRAAWLEAAPRVLWDESAALPLSFVTEAPGHHVLKATGGWDGDRADLFEDVVVRRDATIVDPAGREIARVPIDVRIVARWGRRGWWIVGIAGLALLLALGVLVALRPPKIAGTLLWATEGLEGTVGRLDLGDVGRGKREVRADSKGRLTLDGPGRPIVVVRAERVGGVLLVPSNGGFERRLLVDGLTWRGGRHALRYVSGRGREPTAQAGTDEAPDLLGADFEIETGRVRDAWNAVDDTPDPSR